MTENYRIVTGEEALKELKAGKELFTSSGDNIKYKIVDNCICVYFGEKKTIINVAFNLDSVYRIYEKPRFKLEVGKIYEDKDGGRYFIYAYHKKDKRFIGVKQGNNIYSVYRFKEDGTASKYRCDIKNLVKEVEIK